MARYEIGYEFNGHSRKASGELRAELPEDDTEAARVVLANVSSVVSGSWRFIHVRGIFPPRIISREDCE